MLRVAIRRHREGLGCPPFRPATAPPAVLAFDFWREECVERFPKSINTNCRFPQPGTEAKRKRYFCKKKFAHAGIRTSDQGARMLRGYQIDYWGDRFKLLQKKKKGPEDDKTQGRETSINWTCKSLQTTIPNNSSNSLLRGCHDRLCRRASWYVQAVVTRTIPLRSVHLASLDHLLSWS